MKTVILAGGFGTRLSEETQVTPKPLVEIGGYPILWHIMKIYSHYGLNDFVICLGYKGYMIKEYFLNYGAHASDITVNTRSGDLTVHNNRSEDWNVTLVDTGPESMTGGRVKRVADFLDEDDFCLTYGDGVADINIAELLDFHKQKGKKATVTAVTPPGRFGALGIENNEVKSFLEKPAGERGIINGGFFVLNPSVLDLIEGDHTTWEQEPLETLAKSGELAAYRHNGFWRPMDTLRDKNELNKIWAQEQAPWKVW